MTNSPIEDGPKPNGSEGAPPKACRNCGVTLTDRYCASCGQEDVPLDPSLKDVLADLWETVSNLEGRALQSLIWLFALPGHLTREYLAGRRVRWMTPSRIYLLVSVVYFGLTSLTGWGRMEFNIDVRADSDLATQQELESLGFTSQSELDAAAGAALATWLPRAMFLLMPMFAGLLAVARPDAGLTYPQHLVFSLHLHAAAFGGFLMAALVTGLAGGEVFDEAVTVASLAYAAAYFLIAERSVYGGSVRRNIVLGAVIAATYWMMLIAVTIAILLPLVIRPVP